MPDAKLDVRVFPVAEPMGNLKAFASVTINDLIAIRGVRVMDGDKGLFVSMPQSKDKAGEYHDIAFPVQGDLRRQITAEVLGEYARSVDKKPLAAALADGAGKAAEQVLPAPRTDKTKEAARG